MPMKTRPLLSTLAIVLGAASCLAFAAGSPAARLGSARVYIAAEGCHGHVYRPRKRVILACADANLYVTNLDYSAYQSREAKATGIFHLNDCTPNCAGGRFHAHEGSIRFFDVVQCVDGRRYFARARYSFPGRGGNGTADIEPFITCRSTAIAAAVSSADG